MDIGCNGENCRQGRWMRSALIAAGLYHILFALWANAWPNHGFDILGLPRPIHPMLWRALGLIAGMLGFALLLAARAPRKHWLTVLSGFIKSAFTTIFVAVAVSKGELPASSLGFLFVDDIVWIVPFGAILWAAILENTGIPPNHSRPYSPAEAGEIYRLSTGKTIAEESEERPLVLVFLRHFGCTFTRQILRGLQDLERQAEANGAKLVLVHMLQSGEEIDYLGQNSGIPRIADPHCELYRAFGLGKGGFLELFGPHVWWRGTVSVFKGCGVGHLAGDGLQMPGAFIFHKSRVLSSQPARTAADLPDLTALFKHTPAV